MITTYYISKYALTEGIRKKKCVLLDGACWVRDARDSWAPHLKIGRDAHLTLEDAIADAEKKRDKKIASLKKKIASFEKKTFAIAVERSKS